MIEGKKAAAERRMTIRDLWSGVSRRELAAGPEPRRKKRRRAWVGK